MAGPAALAVALILLPGWVYWRLEASARTTRTALGEFFEVVAAGTLATGATMLLLLSLPDDIRGYEVQARLVDPADLTDITSEAISSVSAGLSQHSSAAPV